jgi:uncharacterized protein (DUF2141 family)
MKLKKMYIGAYVCLSAIVGSAATVTIKVSNVQVGKGDVRIGIFNAAEEFPNGTYFKGTAVQSTGTTIQVEIADLKPGTYAISVYQDHNGNKQIDKNFVGIPKEPYGFSGAWKKGGASFEKASFELKPSGAVVLIKMK